MLPQAGHIEATYKRLAKHGARIFCIDLNNEKHLFLHPDKTLDQWRDDMRQIIAESANVPKGTSTIMLVYSRLSSLGYVEVIDVVADVFEGKIRGQRGRIVDDPSHETQPDGFGHFGWGKHEG